MAETDERSTPPVSAAPVAVRQAGSIHTGG